jgi:hypothetical protein
LAVAVLTACGTDPAITVTEDPQVHPELVMMASDDAATPGSRVHVALALLGSASPMHAIHGDRSFDPDRLELVGQVPVEGTATVLNTAGAEAGELQLLSIAGAAGGPPFVVLGLDVLDAAYLDALRFRTRLAVDAAMTTLTLKSVDTVELNHSLAAVGVARHLSKSQRRASPRPTFAPGPCPTRPPPPPRDSPMHHYGDLRARVQRRHGSRSRRTPVEHRRQSVRHRRPPGTRSAQQSFRHHRELR